MTVEAYLQETGVGAYANFFVPDLTGGHGSPVDLVMLFESPHVDELHAKHPLAGRAGRDALAFLAGNVDADRSLGEEIARRQKGGDFRVAIVNVSQVPLQRQAITTATPLDDKQWISIEGLRRSRAREIQTLRAPRRQYAEYLLADLGRRVALLGIRPATTVAAAGKFAQMFWRSLRQRRRARCWKYRTRPVTSGHALLGMLLADWSYSESATTAPPRRSPSDQ